MITLSPNLRLLLQLATTQAVLARRFDSRLPGLGLTEFLILWQLDAAPDQKMRRIDLAEAIGLTASGVTRLLAPMEKIGLVKRELNTADARVSFVAIAKSGKRMLEEALENAEVLAADALKKATKADLEGTKRALEGVSGRA
jgi:DNA-binding MarR family transcriptional regulator